MCLGGETLLYSEATRAILSSCRGLYRGWPQMRGGVIAQVSLVNLAQLDVAKHRSIATKCLNFRHQFPDSDIGDLFNDCSTII